MFNHHFAQTSIADIRLILGLQWQRVGRRPRVLLSLVLSLCLAPLLAAAAEGSRQPLEPAASTRPASSTPPARLTPIPPAAASVNPGTNVVAGRKVGELDDKQKLAPGDRVTFRVVEDQEPPRPLTVTDAGELDIPELGLISAAGKTCKQLALEIKPKLEATTYYQATVIIGIELLNRTMSGRRVYVAGEVPRPGPQEIPGGETWSVTKAIMRAGGFTQYADKKGVRLVRGGGKGAPGKSLTVNVVDVWEKGRTELDLPVEPEDVIYGPARAWNY